MGNFHAGVGNFARGTGNFCASPPSSEYGFLIFTKFEEIFPIQMKVVEVTSS